MIKNYRDLKLWQKGVDLADNIYNSTGLFPKKDQFGIGNHLEKTAVSIPSNVAEGNSRQYTKEYIQFLYFSLGSCAELDTQMIIAKRRNLIKELNYKMIDKELFDIRYMTLGLIKSLRNK